MRPISVFRDILFFGIRLARKTADEEVKIFKVFRIDFRDIGIKILSFRIIQGFVSGCGKFVDLAASDTFKAARFLETAAETADPGKCVKKFNCYKTTSLLLFSL